MLHKLNCSFPLAAEFELNRVLMWFCLPFRSLALSPARNGKLIKMPHNEIYLSPDCYIAKCTHCLIKELCNHTTNKSRAYLSGRINQRQ